MSNHGQDDSSGSAPFSGFASASAPGSTCYYLVSPERSITLLPGEYVIGRSVDADIVFSDDPLVSRRHARLVVTQDGVDVEDLGSSNGTFVGAELVQHRLSLPPGATLRVGREELVLRRAPAPRPSRGRRSTAPEVPSVRFPAAEPDDEIDGTTQRGDPVSFIHDDAKRALGEGRVEEAKKLVQPMLELLDMGRYDLSPASLERASTLGLLLARATGEAMGADWVLAAHLKQSAAMSQAVLSLFESVLAQGVSPDQSRLDEYLSMLRRRGSELRDDSLLAACQRIEAARR